MPEWPHVHTHTHTKCTRQGWGRKRVLWSIDTLFPARPVALQLAGFLHNFFLLAAKKPAKFCVNRGKRKIETLFQPSPPTQVPKG